ncbi:hypothetical protein L1999_15820 [Neobacillus drentensis]|uniref:hypothetical protein n=1 Tax=Neobacillus drentensis TaxID=220684 RepID=UPI001F21C314|nr:hypothetical protein [Neobacillus drentensis]ULT54625.1 hypothetical protein L1999_15820 [Neobacillus drentensis]
MFFIPTNVTIGDVKINSPDHSSSINFGPTLLKGINVYGKKSQGFGQQMADATVTVIPIHLVLDDDLIDSPNSKQNGLG